MCIWRECGDYWSEKLCSYLENGKLISSKQYAYNTIIFVDNNEIISGNFHYWNENNLVSYSIENNTKLQTIKYDKDYNSNYYYDIYIDKKYVGIPMKNKLVLYSRKTGNLLKNINIPGYVTRICINGETIYCTCCHFYKMDVFIIDILTGNIIKEINITINIVRHTIEIFKEYIIIIGNEDKGDNCIYKPIMISIDKDYNWSKISLSDHIKNVDYVGKSNFDKLFVLDYKLRCIHTFT